VKSGIDTENSFFGIFEREFNELLNLSEKHPVKIQGID